LKYGASAFVSFIGLGILGSLGMDSPDQLSAKETEHRREAALKRMLSTPHKPHAKPKSKKKPRRVKKSRR
jgi:hypothetical protein